MIPKPGTYQSTLSTEIWPLGRTVPRVQYRTTFGGPQEEHNTILEMIREIHTRGDGKASELIQVFKDAEKIEPLRKAIAHIKTTYVDMPRGLESLLDNINEILEA